jgi:uracil-DNA glycosylase
MSLTIKTYSKENIWDLETDIKKLPLDISWNDVFNELFSDKRFKIIENKIKDCSEKNPEKLYPKPKFLFKTFCMVPLENVRVVFIGQDPYFNHITYKDRICPEAYGLSFSVPIGIPIPSSLENIYKNLLKFKHIKKIPNHGCLDYWAYQGCLMLNSALTVIDKEKNCHQNEWKWFTNNIITYISENKKKVVFVLWGGEAYKKIDLIDSDKHEVVISSHPSGLSAHQQFKSYSSFNDQDHFGLINSYLNEKIDWNLPE